MYFDKLDKKAALIYLKKRLNSKSQFDPINVNNKILIEPVEKNSSIISNNLESKRIIYSFSKLDDHKSIVTVQQKDCSDSIKAFSNRNSRNSRISKNSNLCHTKKDFLNNKENSTHEENELTANPSSHNYYNKTNTDNGKTCIEDYQPLVQNQYQPLVHQSSRDS